ncbi:GmrSD restriction endonuclease domain-containing protein [Geotoga petraea]|uniref:DUF262 domain-containing protein n=1 Tax=Geotoga petraea TaxID=28234 RepID=A0A1G6MPW8_9BACT|nr:DUF262 domain-containing protein [Geotoga petraea]TGG87403.1 DUF262 domain-containing protein [Geotoga petraea]SDC57036.1 Protein of unknown function DUF262 [Geotoga petraea]
MSKYEVNNNSIETILSWIKSKEIAIPEIQRPFVWDSSKVRDLIDSLYKGYPIGYLITWKSAEIKLKDGSKSEGRKIIIDGQQRIMALTASLLGQKVINKDYKKKNITISFNPKEEKFEVANPAIEKNKEWIYDISLIHKEQISTRQLTRKYSKLNGIEDINEVDKIGDALDNLYHIKHKLIGMIELSHSLDIETVTEIFIRINSKGVELSQADFVMSKIAVNETFKGNTIRKIIDYFCHLIENPTDFDIIFNNDKDFANTEYLNKIRWVSKYNEDVYSPEYKDLIRVVFAKNFNRGRLTDLVSLLSGRDFETREYKEEIVENSFSKLEEAVLDFINENNFKRFIMILKSAGIVSSSLIKSKNVLNFGYLLYLKLKDKKVNPAEIETYVRKWVIFSILTGRYSGSPESAFDYDIKRIEQNHVEFIRNEIENALFDNFWENILPSKLEASSRRSPFFSVFIIAQVKLGDKGFLSKDITVKDLVEEKGDIHHIFPKKYLQKNGFNTSSIYNQVANYVYMQSEINIKVKDKSPQKYFNELLEQCRTKDSIYGGIIDQNDLKENLVENAIPLEVFEMTFEDYDDFLKKRRKFMSEKIKKYFFSL